MRIVFFRDSSKGKCLRFPCKEDKNCPEKLTCQQDFISKFCSGHFIRLLSIIDERNFKTLE